MSSILAVAASGMMAASLRLNVSASNVANSQSSGPLPDAIGPGAAGWRNDLPGGAGRIYNEPEGIDHVIVNGLLGFVNFLYFWYRPGGRASPEEIAAQYSDLLLHGLLTPAADPHSPEPPPA